MVDIQIYILIKTAFFNKNKGFSEIKTYFRVLK